jgi:hypothetical protein
MAYNSGMCILCNSLGHTFGSPNPIFCQILTIITQNTPASSSIGAQQKVIFE